MTAQYRERENKLGAMPLAQGSCDAVKDHGQKLESAHSSDLRRQPRTVREEGKGKGKDRKKQITK